MAKLTIDITEDEGLFAYELRVNGEWYADDGWYRTEELAISEAQEAYRRRHD